MNSYLKSLAEQILSATGRGVSKVRFAKTIYYVHKALVKKGLADVADLQFIRMPLGPVPVGFMELGRESNIVVSSKENELAYNAEVYKLKSLSTRIPQMNVEVIAAVTRRLNSVSTSTLVALSHKEPSWLQHNNGETYSLSEDDLKRVLRTPPPQEVDESRDRQLLQARLLAGMLDEIVEESTSLEYPGDD